MVGSAFFNVYLHEIRAYSLLVLEAAILLWLYLRVLNHKRSWPRSLSLILAATVSLYSHPFMALLLASLGVYHLMLERRRESWAQVLGLLLLAGLLFAPWAWITLGALPETAIKDSEDLVRSNLEIVMEFARAVSNGLPLILLLPLVSLRRIRRDANLRMLWFIAAAFLAAMLFFNSAFQTINQVRYFMPGLPVLFLLGGLNLCRSQKVSNPYLCDRGRLVHRRLYACAFLLADRFTSGRNSRSFISIFLSGKSCRTFGVMAAPATPSYSSFPITAGRCKVFLIITCAGPACVTYWRTRFARKATGSRRWLILNDFISDAGRVYFVLDRTIGATPLVPGIRAHSRGTLNLL